MNSTSLTPRISSSQTIFHHFKLLRLEKRRDKWPRTTPLPPPPTASFGPGIAASAAEEGKQKRMKWAVYIAAFLVFQAMVILVFALVVMKVKAPKFRVGELQIQSLTVEQSTPSFNMRFMAPIRVKNTNFGPYKYNATTVDFTYGGVVVGQVIILKSKANFKSTKKIDVEVSLNSSALSTAASSGLANVLGSGVIALGSQGKMNGKVTLMLMFKKKKETEMNCTMAIDVASKAVKSVECK